jgi:hypothetical protein
MLRFLCCFLYAMESLLVLRKWGGDADITSPFFCHAASSLSWSERTDRSVLFCLTLHLMRCASSA